MKLIGFLFGFLASLFGVMPANAEVTDAQLLEMVKQKRYIFHVDRPTNPPREVEVVFDTNGLHVIDQAQEVFSQKWIEIERVEMKGILIVTHFTSEPDFAVPRADLKYGGVIDQFLVFALDQIVNARRPKE
jgi:hypothetical protein